MAHSDRERWDGRYAKAVRHPEEHQPNPVLIEYAPPAAPGIRALELACGLGQDALWLVEQGYEVDALDVSVVALRQARAEMLRRGLRGVNFIAADLDQFPLPACTYELVYVYRFLDRRLFPALRESLRPGGRVIYQTFNVRRREHHPTARPAHTLELGELPGFFPGWQTAAAWEDGPYSIYVGDKPKQG